MVRTFIAIEIAPETVATIGAAIDQLKPCLPAVRWVAPENFHLTIQFLGDIEESQVNDIGICLREALRPFPRLIINAKGLGVFPDRRRPKILWVGLFGSELERLAASVKSVLEPLVFAPEQRHFTPHLTIGRWQRTEQPPGNLRLELNRWQDFAFGASLIDRVILFQSILRPAGVIYSRLRVIDLGND